MNSRNIPQELKNVKQWLAFKGEDKRPCRAYGDYQYCSANAPENYTDFETAVTAVADGKITGIGFATTGQDPYVITDLDGCRDPETGEIDDFAKGVLERFPNCYAEASKSGTGIHLISRSYVEHDYKANAQEREAGREIELFCVSGYVILTGDVLEGRTNIQNVPPGDISALVTELKLNRKDRATYKHEPAPDLLDMPNVDFDLYGALGPFSSLILNDVEIPGVTYPLTADGRIDRSSTVYLAAAEMKSAGYDAATTYTVFFNSPFVARFIDDANKSDGWLWKYCIEKLYKGEDGAVGEDRAPRAVFLTSRQLADSLAPVDWLVKGAVEYRTLGVLFGKEGSYKTVLAFDWVCCVATGTPWLGKHRVKQGPAVYIAGEGSQGLARRFHAWGQEHGVTGEALRDVPAVWSQQAVNIADPDSLSAAVRDTKEILRENYADEDPVLVVVDTLSANSAGKSEDNNDEMSEIMTRLRLAFPKSTCLIVHHEGHSAKGRTRGASAIQANADFLFNSKAQGGYVSVKCKKQKDSAIPPEMSLKHTIVDLGEIDGQKVTGVTFEKMTTTAQEDFSELPAHLVEPAEAVMRVLREMVEEHPDGVPKSDLVTQLIAEEVSSENWKSTGNKSYRQNLWRLLDKMQELGALKTDQDSRLLPG